MLILADSVSGHKIERLLRLSGYPFFPKFLYNKNYEKSSAAKRNKVIRRFLALRVQYTAIFTKEILE